MIGTDIKIECFIPIFADNFAANGVNTAKAAEKTIKNITVGCRP